MQARRARASHEEGHGGGPAHPRAPAEKVVVALLVTLAVGRILLLGSAFPFFNGVDEHRHFDVALKYATGFLPGPEPARFEAATARLLIHEASPEYLLQPDQPTPAPAARRAALPVGSPGAARAMRAFQQNVNVQADAPPVYYALAGAVYRATPYGRFGSLERAYVLRWLDALFLGLAVFATWAFLRRLRPDDPLARLGPALVVAVFPNDIFYSVTSDAFSPLIGALAFFMLLELARALSRQDANGSQVALAVGAGLAMAAAFLTRYTNVVFLGVALVLLLGRLASSRLPRREVAAPVAACTAAALVPVGLWLVRNRLVIGSLSGSHRKVALLGWGYKEPGEILDHPILTLHGFATFLWDLTANFWRGEIAWKGRPLHLEALDPFYAGATLTFVVAAGLALLLGRRGARARAVEGPALLAVGGACGVLVGLSMILEFNERIYPSASYPYFTSGRLVSGVLAPFAVVVVAGIDAMARSMGGGAHRKLAWSALLLIAFVALSSELAVSVPLFGSPYNWFHAT